MRLYHTINAMQPDQIKSFFDRFTNGSYTQEEHQAFINWLQTAPMEEVEVVAEEYYQISGNRPSGMLPNQDLIKKVEAALDQWDREAGEVQEAESPTRVIRMWKKLTVAAVVAGLIGLGVWFLIKDRSVEKPAIAETKTLDVEAPKITKAVISLGDGRRVPIDSIASGMLAIQYNVKVVKNERGEIVYDPSSAQTQRDIAYNTLYNPKGSDVVSLTLADGTKVWLNSESSLQYPVAFAGNERKVSVTGEAYFEVEKNPKKPFRVQFASAGREGIVEVLGTHFNVNAYDDEPVIETTLLEGSVKVNSKVKSIMLKPGEQASLSQSSHTSHTVDVQTVMAWKNGKFDFGEGTDLKQIMRQVARWYDVEVEYKGTIREEFGGTMPRGVTAASLLEKFEMTGRVKFKIEGRKVIVSAQ
jgi:ferric-dicitrate binding protein FerR (iron transport regulator)